MLSHLIDRHGFLLFPMYCVQYLRSRMYSFLIKHSISKCGKRLNAHYTSRIFGVRFINIGDDFFSGPGLWIEAVTSHPTGSFHPSITIGHRVAINSNVHIACINEVVIGDQVLFASNIFITDHNHGCYHGVGEQSAPEIAPNERQLYSTNRVQIGRNCWIGENVSILPGSVIGEGCVIGANAVVTGSIPPNSIVVGSPARVIKYFETKIGQWIPVTEQWRKS